MILTGSKCSVKMSSYEEAREQRGNNCIFSGYSRTRLNARLLTLNGSVALAQIFLQFRPIGRFISRSLTRNQINCIVGLHPQFCGFSRLLLRQSKNSRMQFSHSQNKLALVRLPNQAAVHIKVLQFEVSDALYIELQARVAACNAVKLPQVPPHLFKIVI